MVLFVLWRICLKFKLFCFFVIYTKKIIKYVLNVITLCGSTKFKEEFLNINKWLTLQGNVVISVGLFGQVDHEPILPEEKELLDKIHKAKIDLANEIFVVVVNGYIGNSTNSEIEYAKWKKKNIRYLSNEIEEFNLWYSNYTSRKQSDWNK
jgi:hypothetical protein